MISRETKNSNSSQARHINGLAPPKMRNSEEQQDDVQLNRPAKLVPDHLPLLSTSGKRIMSHTALLILLPTSGIGFPFGPFQAKYCEVLNRTSLNASVKSLNLDLI